ncbi:MAG: hypothetical protein HKN26_10250 [Acidimicrobiales bacterium]|nr:hypothetical protein [Acidimicrobiales bacterium]
MDDRQRYFFVHLMKTGGTVVTLALQRALGRDVVYPGPAFDSPPFAEIDMAAVIDRWPELRSRVTLLAGHFPYCTVEKLDADISTFTVLRDPVDRVLSLLRSMRDEADDDRPLDERYADDFASNPLFPNHMTRMLGTTLAEMPAGLLSPVDLNEHHVEVALHRLASMGAVGFQRDLAGFGALLESRFGWTVGEIGRGNVSKPAPTPEGLRDRIAEDNALDVLLYARALDTVESARGPANHEGSSQ